MANGHADVVSFYSTANGSIKERHHKIKDEPYERFGGKDENLAHQALMLANAKR